MSDGGRSSDPQTASWFAALRRVVGRALDALEDASQSDPSLREDLLLLIGERLPGEPPLEVPSAPGNAAAPAPAAMAQLVVEKVSPAITPPPAPLPLPVEAGWVGPRVVEAAAPHYLRQWSAEPFEPGRVAARCRLKAEACRWQSERSRRLDAGQDVSDGDRKLVARAQASDVYLWMVSPAKWRERSEDAFAIVAGCYDALADAAELMGLADQLVHNQEASMRLLAEAQSGLRAAVEDYASTRRDDDQEAAFAWLRRETDARRVFIEYMQLDHPAPPDNFPDLRRRIDLVRRDLDGALGRDKAVKDTLAKVAWHARKLAQLPAGQGADALGSDLAKIAQAVEAALALGVPPSDVRLREALLPAIDRLPGDEQPMSAALSRVVDAIHDYLDQRDAESADAELTAETEKVDPLVQRARRLVEGRDAVLIGGRPSEPHRRRLEAGLGLGSLNWVRAEHHQSFDEAAAAIRRPGVGLVLIMTRWRSHRDGPAARALCKDLNIPLVELPSGYNLRQVAHQISTQLPDSPAATPSGNVPASIGAP